MPRIKISQAAKEFNVSIPTVVEQLQKKGIAIDATSPNTRLDEAAYDILVEAFQPDRKERERIDRMRHDKEKERDTAAPAKPAEAPAPAPAAAQTAAPATPAGPKVVGHINLDRHNNPVAPKPEPKPVEVKPEPKPEPKPEEKK